MNSETLVLFEDVAIDGHLRAVRNIVVAGRINGDVEGHNIQVTHQAVVNGMIVGDEVLIAGTVNGDVFASKLTLLGTSRVQGDLFHGHLNLHEGSFFEGKSRRYADTRQLAQERTND